MGSITGRAEGAGEGVIAQTLFSQEPLVILLVDLFEVAIIFVLFFFVFVLFLFLFCFCFFVFVSFIGSSKVLMLRP